MTTDPQPKKSIVLPITLTVLVSAIVFGGIGYYLGMGMNTPDNTVVTLTPTPKASTSTLATTASPTSAATATNDTAKWKTYAYTAYNLTIKYPESWHYDVLQGGNEISFNPIGKSYGVEGSSLGVIRLVASPDVKFNVDIYKNDEKVTIGGKTAYKSMSKTGEIDYEFELNGVPVSIVNDTNAISVEQQNVAAYNAIFDQMLNSLSFTK